jgi:hypothetical protein
VSASEEIGHLGLAADDERVHGSDRILRPFEHPEPRGLQRALVSTLRNAGLRNSEHATGQLDRQVFCGHHLNSREPPFGLVFSFSSSAALRWMASSVSNSRMRRRAAINSARSADVSPGFNPLVNAVLSSPVVHHLSADPEVACDVSHATAACD